MKIIHLYTGSSLDELKNTDKMNSKSETVPSSEWLRHFSSLNDQKVISNSEVTDKLKILEQDKIFNGLDFLKIKNQAEVIQFLMKC